jgi:DNA-binding CsgD family transcriptional regulator
MGFAILGDAARVAPLYPQYREWSHQLSIHGHAYLQTLLAMLTFITGNHERAISELIASYDAIDADATPSSVFNHAHIASTLALILAKSDPQQARKWLSRIPSIESLNDAILDVVTYAILPWIRLAHWVINGDTRAAPTLEGSDSSLLYRELTAAIDVLCSRPQRSLAVTDIQSATATLRERQHAHLFATFIEMVAAPATPTLLTKAERDALQLVANGLRTSDIANDLGKAENTILSQIKSAGKKLKCSGRDATVARARELNLIN